MSGSLSKRSDLANDNSCLGLSLGLQGPPEPGQLLRPKGPPGSPQGPRLYGSTELQGGGGLAAPAGEEPANAKWVKDGQNQLRRAAERDQNRNELGPPPEELEVSARNARNAGGGALPLLIDLRGAEEEEDEDEEEEEGDGDSTPVQSDPMTAESEQSGERAPREHGRSASLLFGVRSGTASDEDSSWATLSQGSPAGSSPDDADSFWTRNSFETDSDLPAGWMRVQDTSGTYYWHIPTGTTQWEPPSGLARGSDPGSAGNTPSEEPPLAWTGFAPAERFGEGDFWRVRGDGGHPGGQHPMAPGPCQPPPCGDARPGPANSALWLSPAALAGDAGRGMAAQSRTSSPSPVPRCSGGGGTRGGELGWLGWPGAEVLSTAPPCRDFAYVARDQLTQMLKCHVFRCESPAKNIATSLHEVCSQIMVERRSARALANGLSMDPSRLVEIPFQVEFPAPKSEVVQKFPVCYLGCVPVAKPVG
ncbi:APBB1 protein, partial [Chunga burmeisteri]|nr:APBB1 protein [Chunga burmeisteri]